MNGKPIFGSSSNHPRRATGQNLDLCLLGSIASLYALFSNAQGVQSLQSQLNGQGAGLSLNFDPGASASGAGMGLLNGQSMGGISAGVISGADPKMVANSSPVAPLPLLKPLGPNAFQSYILETTGQALKRWGAEFFDNSSGANSVQSSPFVPVVTGPASARVRFGRRRSAPGARLGLR
jgi:hypothetical protein